MLQFLICVICIRSYGYVAYTDLFVEGVSGVVVSYYNKLVKYV